MKITRRGLGAAACWLWLAVCCVFLAWKFMGPAPVDSDILSLLPAGGGQGVQRAAIELAAKSAAGRTAILVTAPDGPTATAAADDLTKRLSTDGLFISDMADTTTTGRWVFENRNQLVCQRDAKDFTPAEAQRLERRALADVYSVTGAVTGDLLKQDPFLLTIRLAECLPPIGTATPKETQKLVSGRIAASAYRLDAQDKIVAEFAAWKADWTPKGVSAARAGAVFHAEVAANKAKQDFGWIGSVSTIGVSLLFFLAFRTVKSVIEGIVLVFIGVIPGLAVTLMVFPTIHILVFVFAAMLVGIVSDYAVHTLATGPASDWGSLKQRLEMVGRPITVSMATTSLGFGALALFGVPLFEQVAILAGVGIFTAWAFVLLVLIPMDRRPRNAAFLRNWWLMLERVRENVKLPATVVWSVSLALIALSVYGATQIHFLDDVRQFQPRPADLMAEEKIVTSAGYGGSGVTFLLSEGATPDEARQREEAALAQAPPAARILATSRFDPSAARRAENQKLLESELYAPLFETHAAQIGVDPAIDPAHLPAPAKVSGPAWLTEMSGEANGRSFLVAPILDPAGWSGPTVEGVKLIDPAASYSTAFETYRGHAILALVAAFICAIVATLLVYRSWASLSILIPPILAAIMALLIPAALGYPLTFFSFAAALVLVGTGIDYAAFQWEGGVQDDRWTAVAVFIDAATTLLSMGLLVISDTYPVKSFGLTVSIGIAAALCLSHIPRLAALKRTRESTAA